MLNIDENDGMLNFNRVDIFASVGLQSYYNQNY